MPNNGVARPKTGPGCTVTPNQLAIATGPNEWRYSTIRPETLTVYSGFSHDTVRTTG